MYTIPPRYQEELAEYRDLVDKEQIKKIDPVRFKIFRVVHGIYEQRNKNTYMIRIRCAGGTIHPLQLEKVSELADQYGSPFLHITTRQEIQFHNIKLPNTPDILDGLYDIGLSTKGSGGNTVRNITASIESGTTKEEIFDVTPYSIALTNFLLPRNQSFELPRKLKIAFSCSSRDSALAVFNDIGFIASTRHGMKGFKVYIGGSPSVKPMVGHLLFDFIPADRIFHVTLAVMELFDRYGNRKNRHKARLRYIFYKYGKDKVFSLLNEIYNQFENQEFEEPVIRKSKQQPTIRLKPEPAAGNEFQWWMDHYVREQKQGGKYTIEIPVMHGNIKPGQAKSLARLASHFGDDIIRFSRRQNIHLRNIPFSYLGNVYYLLRKTGIETQQPLLPGNLVSCTGADTCQLGICFSKGGLQAMYDKLINHPSLANLNNIDINISGCPNSCGQHLVADLGFAGRVSRNDRIYPSYNVFAGAEVSEGHAVLPEKLGDIAAKDLPDFTIDFLEMYLEKTGQKTTMRAFITREKKSIHSLLAKYKRIPSYEEDKSYYIDWGNNDLFTLEARGGGECSTGLQDMIESEIKMIQKCMDSMNGQQEISEQTILVHALILSSSKLLCHINQIEPTTEAQVFDQVRDSFLDNLNFPDAYAMLIDLVLTGNFTGMIKHKETALEYARDVLQYYHGLNDSLQPEHDLKEITARELKTLLDQEQEIELIDVREPWEKDISDLGGTLIPLSTIEDNIHHIQGNKKTILYCRTGRRSAEAIRRILKNHAMNNLFNLKGGIFAWSEEIDSNIRKY